MDFAVEQTLGSVRSCVTVIGAVDVHTAPDLLTALLSAVEVDPRVTVDLAAVPSMDHQGLATLLHAKQEAESRGGALRLAAVPQPVLELLREACLETAFTIDPALSDDQHAT
jgi:stage II sporulation protein AA (anti-sigma F factor antagonist)